MLFVSHANPEDNQFALWLSLRLAREGYSVWCDLTQLQGGEDFWKSAEKALREDNISRFLYVLSKKSNEKEGPRKELHLALSIARSRTLEDFVIPLKIDDLPHNATNVHLAPLKCISFEHRWARGLAELLEKLEKVGTAKTSAMNPSTVAGWWREHYSAEQGVSPKPEEYLSNWFPIVSVPPILYLHTVSRRTQGLVEPSRELPFPVVQDLIDLASFVPAEDLCNHLDSNLFYAKSQEFETQTILKEPKLLSKAEYKARVILSKLLKKSWDLSQKNRAELGTYELSGALTCSFFRKPQGPTEKVFISAIKMEGKPLRRSVVGFRTVGGRKRYWHFAVEAKPLLSPGPMFAVNAHVLFSSDGKTLWFNKAKMHRARRSQCSLWYNHLWRDRVMLTMNWLAGGNSTLEIPVGPSSTIGVASVPMTFLSPVSYSHWGGLPFHPLDLEAEADAADEEFLRDSEPTQEQEGDEEP